MCCNRIRRLLGRVDPGWKAVVVYRDPDDFRAACIAVRDRHHPEFPVDDERLFTHEKE